jgi:hypothetical protein
VTQQIESLVRRTSTVCEPDPEPNLQPKSRAMEPAGHSHWEIAKRTERGAVNERSPKKPRALVNSCAWTGPSQTSYTPKYYSSSRGTLLP